MSGTALGLGGILGKKDPPADVVGVVVAVEAGVLVVVVVEVMVVEEKFPW